MEEEAVRWNIKVSKETDLTLRTFLGARGMKKGDLSKFIEEAGRVVNQIKRLAEDVSPLPPVNCSPDPTDDFLWARCAAGDADYLATGDKSGLQALERHKGTRIVSASEFAALIA